MERLKKYRIYPADRPITVGETMAVSEDEAVRNHWWIHCKGGDRFAYTDYKPTDFVAVRIQ